MSYHRAQLVDVIWAHHGSQIYHFYEDCPELEKLGESHQEAWYEDDRHESWRCCKTCASRREQEKLSKLSGRTCITEKPADAPPTLDAAPPSPEAEADFQYARSRYRRSIGILVFGELLYLAALLLILVYSPSTGNWSVAQFLTCVKGSFSTVPSVLIFFWAASHINHYDRYVSARLSRTLSQGQMNDMGIATTQAESKIHSDKCITRIISLVFLQIMIMIPIGIAITKYVSNNLPS